MVQKRYADAIEAMYNVDGVTRRAPPPPPPLLSLAACASRPAPPLAVPVAPAAAGVPRHGRAARGALHRRHQRPPRPPGDAPWCAGHVANLRRARERRRAVLLDGGDMFQGTIESNLNGGRGDPRLTTLGYAAAAVGNHEFDYGPEGAVTSRSPNDDPQGHSARAREASFPAAHGQHRGDRRAALPGWDNVRPSVMLTVGGVKVGVVGLSTEATARTTLSLNFRNLTVRPLARTPPHSAAALRAEGLSRMVVAHAGGACRHFDDPADLSTCEAEEEIFQVCSRAPAGAVDVIVAGHTHRGVAHVVNGVAVIRSFASGRAFGRVDSPSPPTPTAWSTAASTSPTTWCGAEPEGATSPDPRPARRRPAEGAAGVVAGRRCARRSRRRWRRPARCARERRVGFRAETAVRTRYRDESAFHQPSSPT